MWTRDAAESRHQSLLSAPEGNTPLPIPFGWFALAYGADLAPGDVRPLYFFDEHMVLFRTQDGEAHVTAAFCPHLGAHLGHGGTVQGNALVCPFHGWQFDGAGMCVNVPYAKAMPRRVATGPCLYSYPVQERNQMIWAWHHPRRLPPLFELDDLPELTDSNWSELERFEWEVATPIQEAGENAVDIAHFVTVHGAQEVPKASISLAGHRRDTEAIFVGPAIDENGNIDLTRTAPIHLVTRNCGPGMSSQSFSLGESPCGDSFENAAHSPTGVAQTWLKRKHLDASRTPGSTTVMLGTVTPITASRMKLGFAFTKPKEIPSRFVMIIDALIAEIVRQVQQDIPIWENKIYRESPILCDGDGPIAKYRKWFSQFYDTAESCPATPPLASAALQSRKEAIKG